MPEEALALFDDGIARVRGSKIVDNAAAGIGCPPFETVSVICSSLASAFAQKAPLPCCTAFVTRFTNS